MFSLEVYMYKKLFSIVVSLSLVLGLFASVSPVLAKSSEGGEVSGIIAAIDTGASTITINGRKGSPVTLTVTLASQIRKNGKTAVLAELGVGDKAEAKYNPVTLEVFFLKSEMVLKEVSGTIKAVDTGAGTITITPRNLSADVVLNVGPSTVITRGKTVVTLADLKVGDKVEAKYGFAGMLALRINAKANIVELKGVIKSVDNVAGTVTITKLDGITDVTLTAGPSTIIKRQRVVTTLSALLVSDKVEAKYDAGTMVALSISASVNTPEIEGVIKAIDTVSVPNTITITKKESLVDVTLTVDGTTIIKRLNVVTTLGSLLVGDKVNARYTGATLAALSISAGPNLLELEGVIKSIDTGAGTVTITKKDSAVDVTLTVDLSTVVKRSNVVTTLSSLLVGDRVEAKYDGTTLVASFIFAEANILEVEGRIKSIDAGAGTVTITRDGTTDDVTVTVTVSTLIRKNKAAAVFADLTVGDEANARYNGADMTAVSIDAKTSH